MKWPEPICLRQPLRDVRCLVNAPRQDWQELLREREDAAHAEGRRHGQDALRQQLIQQRTEIAELQRGILDSMGRAIPELVHEAEGALIQLALEAAQKIVAGLPLTAEMVEGVIRDALKQVEDTAEVLIQLHPEDLALLLNHSSTILQGVPGAGPLRFASASEVTRGGCIVQTRMGVVDARREIKIEQLKQTVSS